VVKAISPDLPHKSDAGGVVLGVSSAEDAGRAAAMVLQSVRRARPEARLCGVLVEEQLVGGVECVAGVAGRSVLGPAVMFGLGGVFVEVLDDVVFRLAPLDEADAAAMLDEVRASRILRGYRGSRGVDRAALVHVLLQLGELARTGEIDQLDINPLLALPDRAVALDATATLRPRQEDNHGGRRTEAMRDLTALLEPASVAVIGASTNPDKSGGMLLANIVRGGYAGRIYPINPRATEILGHRAYPSIESVPEPVDVAFVVLPRPAVRQALEACARKGVGSAVVITAGFREVGAEGALEQEAITQLARSSGLRVIGPNTIGLVAMQSKLLASFVPFPDWQDGRIAIFAQTGIFAGAPMLGLMSARHQRIGVRMSVDVGNKPDVDEVDFLGYVAPRNDVGVVGLYLESIADPAAFLALATAIKREKPVVVFKPGRTPAGAAASASHTGSLASDDRILDAGLRQYGLVRAADFEEFIAFLRAFSYQRPPRGSRVGIVTFTGGLGVVAADEAADSGLELVRWAPETQTRLQQLVPPWQPVGDPADLWVALDVVEPRRAHEEAFDAALSDPNVDAVLGIVLVVPGADFEGVREAFAGLRERHPDKPLFLVLYGGPLRERWLDALEGLNIPVFESSRLALRTLAAMRGYAAARDRVYPASA